MRLSMKLLRCVKQPVTWLGYLFIAFLLTVPIEPLRAEPSGLDLPGAIGNSSAGAAAQAPLFTELFLDAALRVDFTPSQVFFLVGVGEQGYVRLEATLIPPFRVEGGAGNSASGAAGQQIWRAGVRWALPSETTSLKNPVVTYSVIIVGEGNKFSSLPARRLDLSSPLNGTPLNGTHLNGASLNGTRLSGPSLGGASATTLASADLLFGGSIDNLREHLLKRKQESRSWQTQVDAQDDSLRRLRADADIVADLGRIVEVREETDRVQQSIRGFVQDQANLEEFVRLVRSGPQPRNFAARERQLTKQIVELADAAKGTETGEFARRSEAEREVQRKLGFVEQSRSLDYDALQRELVQLRKQRRDLEGGDFEGGGLAEGRRNDDVPVMGAAVKDRSRASAPPEGNSLGALRSGEETPDDYVR